MLNHLDPSHSFLCMTSVTCVKWLSDIHHTLRTALKNIFCFLLLRKAPIAVMIYNTLSMFIFF